MGSPYSKTTASKVLKLQTQVKDLQSLLKKVNDTSKELKTLVFYRFYNLEMTFF